MAFSLKKLLLKIKKDSPKLLMADVLKIVAQRWRSLSEKDRSKYQKEADREKELSKARLGQNLLKTHNINIEALLQQAKVEKLEKPKKRVKRDISDSVSTNSNSYGLSTPSLLEESQDIFPINNNFKCINFDASDDGFLSPLPVNNQSFQFEPIQVNTLPQLPTSLEQTQEWNLPNTFTMFSGEATKENVGGCELPALPDNFRSASELYMSNFGENAGLHKADSFTSLHLGTSVPSLEKFPSLNLQDFAFQENWVNSFQH